MTTLPGPKVLLFALKKDTVLKILLEISTAILISKIECLIPHHKQNSKFLTPTAGQREMESGQFLFN